MITEPKLERDNSPPDKWIAVSAPKRPEKPIKPVQSNFLYWFIIICGIISFIEWYR